MKPGDALSPVRFIFALEYATGKVRINLKCLKLNDTHQLLVSADDVNLLADSVYGIKREREREREKGRKKKGNVYFCWSIMRSVLWDRQTKCILVLLRRTAEVIRFCYLNNIRTVGLIIMFVS